MLQWGMRQSAEVTNQLLSVERILEYEVLPREIEPAIPKKPPTNWPNLGEVVFNNMGLRYFPEGSLVLKNLNFVVRPKEKVTLTKSSKTYLKHFSFVIYLLSRSVWSAEQGQENLL